MTPEDKAEKSNSEQVDGSTDSDAELLKEQLEDAAKNYLLKHSLTDDELKEKMRRRGFKVDD